MTEQDTTILVVDDTEDNLDLLEFALKRKPVKMLRANSGKECLTIASERKPDVILLDIQMPEMDGFETLRHLRNNPTTSKIPVIFLTAQRKDPTSIEQGLLLGADEYLTKPIDTDELLVRTRTLVRLKRMEAELERTKADFMAMLVHDLRSPIVGIKSVIDFLKETDDRTKPLSDEQYELLDSAHDASKRMLELINDLLDLSKYEAGNISLDRQEIPISLVIDKQCRQMEIQSRQKHITIKTKYSKELPNAYIDAAKIGQVMMNLLSNALKFAKEGSAIEVVAEIQNGHSAEKLPGGGFIQVSVTDNGAGVPKEELASLFERYKQLSSTRRIRQKGTGLGLSICKLIAEAHGGTISAESEPGVRTTFRFTVPAVRQS